MTDQQSILQLLRMLKPHMTKAPKIRIGSRGDGGYVINDDLIGLGGLISLGVGNDVSFDWALAERGLPVFQYDPTVDEPPTQHPNFVFRKLAWARNDSENARSIVTMLHENEISGSDELILKFDVEGAEWDALQSVTPDMIQRFRIIVGEFHWLDNIIHLDHFGTIRQVLSLLTKNHVATHLHANNCCGVALVEGVVVPRLLEVSFLRRDRGAFIERPQSIPSDLDGCNIPGRPELVLTPFW
jgi:hypothetical protein